MIYKAMYKCRLCGKVYENGAATTNREIVVKAILHLACTGKPSEPQAPLLLEPHYCNKYDNGDIGIADFIGWREAPET